MLTVVTYLLHYLRVKLQSLYGLSLLQDIRNRSRPRGFICQSVILVLMVDVSTLVMGKFNKNPESLPDDSAKIGSDSGR